MSLGFSCFPSSDAPKPSVILAIERSKSKTKLLFLGVV